MSDPMDTAARLGLPSTILHALVPRQSYMHLPAVKAPEKTDTGAHFSHNEEPAHASDVQLFSELRQLAELHRAHQASGSGSDQSS